MSAPQEYAQLSTYLTTTENLDLRNVSLVQKCSVLQKILAYFISQIKSVAKERDPLKFYLSD